MLQEKGRIVTVSPDSHITIAVAGAYLRAGRLTCTDLLDACLEQIDAHEPQVRAWVHLDASGARAQARRLDEELSAGHDRGDLHGIPVTVKDVIDVAGLPTQAGSPLLSDNLAAVDSAAVRRAREAGAVIMGKSTTTQFAFNDPSPSRNPWRLSRTPGGSSSGPAAALAAGMCLGGLGTQTGGSLLRPASYCGVAALKPTWGRVSVFGVVPLAFNLDHVGVMASDCAGLAVMLDALTKAGHADPFTSDAPALNCIGALADPIPPPRLGRLTGLFDRNVDNDVASVYESSLERIRDAGGSVTHIAPPSSGQDVAGNNRCLLAIQAAFAHRERFPSQRDSYLPLIADLLDEGLAASATALPDILGRLQETERSVR